MNLEQARNVSVGDLANLPVIDLMGLKSEANDVLKKAKDLKEWIDNAVAFKYEEQMKLLRNTLGKDTGVVHIEEHGVKISCDQSKKPAWYQKKLSEIVQRISQSGDDPSEFVDISYKVSERKYEAWPSSLKEVFEGARTLKTGKPTYSLRCT